MHRPTRIIGFVFALASAALLCVSCAGFGPNGLRCSGELSVTPVSGESLRDIVAREVSGSHDTDQVTDKIRHDFGLPADGELGSSPIKIYASCNGKDLI